MSFLSIQRSRCLIFAATALSVLMFSDGCTKKQTEVSSTDTTMMNNGVPDTTHASSAAVPSSTTAIAGKALDGQKLFYSTDYGKIKVACASCHSDGTSGTDDSRIRPGHTLVGVTSRTSTWNGEFKGPTLSPTAWGAARCAVAYMHKGDDIASVLSTADAEALNAYYEAIKNGPHPMTANQKILWVTPPAVHEHDAVDETKANAAAKAILMLPGDPGAGKTLYSRTCEYCHSLQDKKNAPPLAKTMKEPKDGARAARVGQEAMPFFTKDILTDQQIADVLAYIEQELGS